MNKFFAKSGPYSIMELADEFGLQIFKNGNAFKPSEDIFVEDIKTLIDADSKSISFLANKKYIADFKDSKALCCIVGEESVKDAPKDLILLVSQQPYVDFAKISAKFYNTHDTPSQETSPKAHIDETAVIGPGSEIMAGAYIDKHAKIGSDVKIFPNVYIGENVEIAEGCTIYHGATLRNCVVGKKTVIHGGVRIGQDGFGFAFDNGKHIKVPQIGSVIIGNDVEIGANTTIDRGTIDNTIIGDMCKIDNLVQIGHNVVLGIGCIIVSQVGISGSTKLGNFVQVGGQTGVAGHVNVGDAAQIAARSGVISDVDAKEVVAGMPHQPIKQFFRQAAILKKLALKKGQK